MKNCNKLLNDLLEFLIPFVKQVLETILKEINMYLENNPHTKPMGFMKEIQKWR